VGLRKARWTAGWLDIRQNPVGESAATAALNFGTPRRRSFDAFFFSDAAGTFEACDLGSTRPFEVADDFCNGRDFAGFDAPVALVRCLERSQIRRRIVVATACVRGEKDRRMIRRCQHAV
jgi:hypothetical protein